MIRVEPAVPDRQRAALAAWATQSQVKTVTRTRTVTILTEARGLAALPVTRLEDRERRGHLRVAG